MKQANHAVKGQRLVAIPSPKHLTVNFALTYSTTQNDLINPFTKRGTMQHSNPSTLHTLTNFPKKMMCVCFKLNRRCLLIAYYSNWSLTVIRLSIKLIYYSQLQHSSSSSLPNASLQLIVLSYTSSFPPDVSRHFKVIIQLLRIIN